MSEKILLIDNDQDFVDLLTQEMLYKDMEVLTAVSLEKALKMIAADNFDLIVLSLMISEKNGFNVLKAIKEIEPYSEIILLTDHDSVEKGIKAMKLGASILLNKSMNIQMLSEKISRALKKKMLAVKKNV